MGEIWIPSQRFLNEQARWIKENLEQLKEVIPNLVQLAVDFFRLADPPYSHFSVGASVLCLSNNMYGGVNSEPCVYTTTKHAEGGAIYNAILHGEIKECGTRDFVRAIAVSSLSPEEEYFGPCGICRQTIREYAHMQNALVIGADEGGEILFYTSLQLLLPLSFGPEHL